LRGSVTFALFTTIMYWKEQSQEKAIADNIT